MILVGGGYLSGVYQQRVSDNFRIPGTDSQAAYDLLDQRFSSQNGATATVVFAADRRARSLTDGRAADGRRDVGRCASRSCPGVTSVSNPISTNPSEDLEQVAAKLPAAGGGRRSSAWPTSIPEPIATDGRIAYATVTYDRSTLDLLEQLPRQRRQGRGGLHQPLVAAARRARTTPAPPA